MQQCARGITNADVHRDTLPHALGDHAEILELLQQALDAAEASAVQTIWEGALVAGIPMHAIEGDAGNIKITTAADWALALALDTAAKGTA